jgi:hypothetical protein
MVRRGTLQTVRLCDLPYPGPRPQPENPLRGRALTWRNLCREEPGLAVLAKRAQGLEDNGPYFCANSVWFGYGDVDKSFRNRLDDLAGWWARNPRLRTSGCYDRAYDHLYGLLPDCRECLCP